MACVESGGEDLGNVEIVCGQLVGVEIGGGQLMGRGEWW